MKNMMLKMLLVLILLAEYTKEYSEKKLVWIGFDMGWSAFRMVLIMGSTFLLFFLIYYIFVRLFGK